MADYTFDPNTGTITSGVSKTGFSPGSWGQAILNSLKNGWRSVLFLEAMRNLAWSRGYLWYVELDGVPNPFQRGGVIGLPCKNITFSYASGTTSHSWEAGINNLSVPKGGRSLGRINLSVIDDEQGTLRQFFERWYNMVYNPYYGVLPVTEACKQISIYFQKGSRRNIKRVYYDIDVSISSLFGKGVNLGQAVKNLASQELGLGGTEGIQKSTDSIDFLVYPSDDFTLNLSSGESNLIEFNVNLEVAYFVNQDFGNPNVHNGVKTIFDVQIGEISDGSSWIDKIADYI